MSEGEDQLAMDCEKIKTLLDRVGKTLEKQQPSNVFNGFNICRIGSDEVRHSAIIAALLDPRGALKQGVKPLKAFFRVVGLGYLSEHIGERVYVDTEYSIISRRMDIVIHSDNFCVVIENKTVTVDHDMQLEDYLKWLQKQKQDQKALLYLTYHGNRAVNYQGNDYKPISYKEHICNWLKKCEELLEDSEKAVFCRQYRAFIENILLGENSKMQDDEFKAICENFEAALEVSNRINEAKARLLNEKLTPALKNAGFNVCEDNSQAIMTGRGLDYNVHKQYGNCQIAFEFDSYNFRGSRIRISLGCEIPENVQLDDGWKEEKPKELVKHDGKFLWDDNLFMQLAKEESDKAVDQMVKEYEKRFNDARETINRINLTLND